MCQQTDKELPLVDFYPETNAISLESQYDEQGFIEYFNDQLNKVAHDYQFNFDSLSEVYHLLEFYTQLSYVDCYQGKSIFDPIKKIDTQQFKNSVVNKLTNEEKETGYQINNNLIESEPANFLNSITVNNTTSTTSTLTVTFENPQSSSIGNQHFFEFDLSLSDDNPSAYFVRAVPKITYDSLVFGSRIASNGGVQLTRGTLILDTSSYINPTAFDITRNTINVNIQNNTPISPFNLISLTTTPQPAVHVKMEVLNCSHSSNLTSSFTYLYSPKYSYNPINLDTIISYDTTSIANSLTVLTTNNCNPIITSISPLYVAGGIGDTVTLNGIFFGDGTNPGHVFLSNADREGTVSFQ